MIYYDGASINITSGDHTFEDIYNAINDEKIINRLNNFYQINANLVMGNGTQQASVTTKNESIEITGKLFQINKFSSFISGEVDKATMATLNGSYISCPNIDTVYGFGSNKLVDGYTLSGNLYLYGSTLKIWGFWGFYGGDDQVVESINNQIIGYGRISGKDSILFHNMFEKSHGRYGVISPAGKIKLFKDNYCFSSSEYNGSTYTTSAVLYFNAEYSPGLLIDGGDYKGYKQLLYCENNLSADPIGNTVTLNNVNYHSGSDVYFGNNSKVKINIQYTVNAKVLDSKNDPVVGAHISTYDENNNLLKEYVTDSSGSVPIILPKEIIMRDSRQKFNTIKIEYNGDIFTSSIVVEPKNYETLLLKLGDEATANSGHAVESKIDNVTELVSQLIKQQRAARWRVTI